LKGLEYNNFFRKRLRGQAGGERNNFSAVEKQGGDASALRVPNIFERPDFPSLEVHNHGRRI
jgi:hypothetical protein